MVGVVRDEEGGVMNKEGGNEGGCWVGETRLGLTQTHDR